VRFVTKPRAKQFRYAVALERSGRIDADGASPLAFDEAWTPEHLVLAGLARCTLQSLRFHAARAGVELAASAAASGRVTKREHDGRYAFVEVAVDLDVEVEPEPAAEELRELLGKAERDCFVGASLQPPPRYSWRVNGRAV
jgi:organic hydroperoxide reductase OsmC/OhrA